jgi:hypothetical protein
VAIGVGVINSVSSSVEIGSNNTDKLALSAEGVKFAGRSLPQILSTTTGINAKSVAATALYTVPTGKSLIITAAYVRCTAASSIVSGPTAEIEVQGIGPYLTGFAMTDLTETDTVGLISPSPNTVFLRIAQNSVVRLNITSGASGTSQTVAVDLVGYLV